MVSSTHIDFIPFPRFRLNSLAFVHNIFSIGIRNRAYTTHYKREGAHRTQFETRTRSTKTNYFRSIHRLPQNCYFCFVWIWLKITGNRILWIKIWNLTCRGLSDAHLDAFRTKCNYGELCFSHLLSLLLVRSLANPTGRHRPEALNTLWCTTARTYIWKSTERTTTESVWHKRKSGSNWRRTKMLAYSQPSPIYFRQIAEANGTNSRQKPNACSPVRVCLFWMAPFLWHPMSSIRSARRFCCMLHENGEIAWTWRSRTHHPDSHSDGWETVLWWTCRCCTMYTSVNIVLGHSPVASSQHTRGVKVIFTCEREEKLCYALHEFDINMDAHAHCRWSERDVIFLSVEVSSNRWEKPPHGRKLPVKSTMRRGNYYLLYCATERERERDFIEAEHDFWSLAGCLAITFDICIFKSAQNGVARML